MEIILNGPGGTVATWELTEAAYNYWKDKPRKMLFDFSWNLPDMREGNHFDEEHPENQNIKLTNKKDPYIKIRKNNKWKLADRKIEVLDLIDSKCFLLRTKYNKILEMTNNLTEEQQKFFVELIFSSPNLKTDL